MPPKYELVYDKKLKYKPDGGNTNQPTVNRPDCVVAICQFSAFLLLRPPNESLKITKEDQAATRQHWAIYECFMHR